MYQRLQVKQKMSSNY